MAAVKKKTKKPSPFAEIAQGLSEAINIAKGEADPATFRAHVPDDIDVRALRTRMNMTQPEFADCFGFNVARLRDWEQKRSSPDMPMRAYLLVIQSRGNDVRRILGVSGRGGRVPSAQCKHSTAKTISARRAAR